LTNTFHVGDEVEQSKRELFCVPHGYEGQGAEHQGEWAYLQLCARQNMFVADCTTPANFFTC
jgi:2-oxoglutarate dehydrogenase complex dehydrogenase (E1) component-like enzyme